MTTFQLIGVFALFVPLAAGDSPARIYVQGIGIGGKPDFAPSNAELALLPQKTVATTDRGTRVTFQGVLLTDLLAKVDIPSGKQFQSTMASYYLVAERSDGQGTVFAWTEIDPLFEGKAMYVVTRRNGRPLQAEDGPFELVVPADKGDARWVRQLFALRVEPNRSPYQSEQAHWILEHLPELESIRVGMTRDQLLRIFMPEGGLSTRTARRYDRKCGYVKVDVEFVPAGDPDRFREDPRDRITRISKPYLQLAIMD